MSKKERVNEAIFYKCQIVTVNDCECVQICPVLHSPPSLTDTLYISLIKVQICLKGEGWLQGERKDDFHFVSQLIANA